MTLVSATTLASILAEHRAPLLADWQTASVDIPGGQHPAERALLLASLLDGLIHAADGDSAQLNERLRLARALRSSGGEAELAGQLDLLFRFRSVARPQVPAAYTSHLDALLDRAALTLTHAWTVSASALEQNLREAELLAASLSNASEQADRVALQLANLNAISALLTGSLELDDLLSAVEQQLLAITDAAQVLTVLAAADGTLQVESSSGAHPAARGTPITAPADIITQAVTQRTLLVVLEPDAAQQSAWYAPDHAVLAMPLAAQGDLIGALVLLHTDAAWVLDTEHQQLISAVGAQLAIAVENARLYARQREFNATLERRVHEATGDLATERDMLELMHRISIEVSGTLDVDVLLETCLDMVARLVQFTHGTIALVENETGQLVDRAVSGTRAGALGWHIPGQGLVGWVAQHRQPALVPDIARDPRWDPQDGAPDAERVGALLVAPLLIQRELKGVIALGHDTPGHFDQSHLRLLTAASTAIALGINNALLYTEQERMVEQQSRRVATERRNSAQRDAILQSLSDGVIVCGDGGSVLVANRAASRILNRDVEELVTWRLPELIGRLLGSHSNALPVESVLRNPYDDQGRPRHYSATFALEQRTIKVSLDPVLLDDKYEEVIGAVAVLRDITREVESDRLKDEFIGTLSHELRTPMTSIKGYTQLMVMGSLGPLNDSQKQFLGTISQNTERMITIINDLLDVTKIETGSVVHELDMRPVLLAEAISTALIDYTPRIQARAQELHLDVPLTLPLVRADARRLYQVLANLISNAVKYTPVGGTLTISADVVDEHIVPLHIRDDLRPGQYVRVAVRDTGVGIEYPEHDKIFERFHRVQNALTIEAGGTGLGLAMVRGLVRIFGGRVWVDSALGEGATFSFVLPVA